eukprot:TRINITY_DN21604_c0_g1_i2.p1 TRINITY_DN21604_c0_g1~~TRINITY_DN21604_c0_g1_i2.p1  ORF type:complete len:552 (-),score=96.41 TRINITY_DN21604_c0_g1_i2:34-1689(-)
MSGGIAHWSGLILLEPGSKIRLKAVSGSCRVNLGRARNIGPNVALSVDTSQWRTEKDASRVCKWLEVSIKTGKASDPPKASLEILRPVDSGTAKGVWEPLPQSCLRRPELWPLVMTDSTRWLDSNGQSCAELPAPTRMHRSHVRKCHTSGSGKADSPVALALLVVIAASPAPSGVGCMTPNWTLLAALEEAMYSSLGPNYELHVAFVSEEEQLAQITEESVSAALSGAECAGVVYFLSPQQVKGAFKTKSYLVHDEALFSLMHRLESAGFPTVWPHPLHLYKLLAGKEWHSQLCLSTEYCVPLTTRVPRGAVAKSSIRAAKEAVSALAALKESVSLEKSTLEGGATAPSGFVVKIGYSWKSEGVRLCADAEEVAVALQEMAAAGRHSSFLVQEKIAGVVCEASVYFIQGRPFQQPQYYKFPEHKAPPQYINRKEAAKLLGSETAQINAEKVMLDLASRWFTWARAQCCSPIPFLRVDFLLALPPGEPAPAAQVWTGEVTELGGAVNFQELNDNHSRNLVMEAVVKSFLEIEPVSEKWLRFFSAKEDLTEPS